VGALSTSDAALPPSNAISAVCGFQLHAPVIQIAEQQTLPKAYYLAAQELSLGYKCMDILRS
jgi:hypothetical protein